MKTFFENRCADDAYCIGYRYSKKKLYKGNVQDEFKVIKPSWRYWYADPIINKIYEQEYIFCEMYDRIKNKGVIGISYFKKNNKLSKPQKILECSEHLSFPVIFLWKDSYYMCPCIGNEILRFYKMGSNEREWYFWKEIRTKKVILDAIFEIKNDELYMITSECISEAQYSKDYKSKEIVYKVHNLENEKELVFEAMECEHYLCKNDVRNAGKLIFDSGEIIQVLQGSNKSKGYGNYIQFAKVNNTFAKDFYLKIEGEQLNTPVYDTMFYSVKGLHTYVYSEQQKCEVIDLKMKAFSTIFIWRYIKENVKILLKI